MNNTTRIITSIAALIGATVVIATPVPASAAGSARLGVCLAIDDEPLCDVVRPTRTGGGSGTDPAVVIPDDRTDASSGCVQVGHIQACAE
jgi:hypothetical protein